MSSKEEIEALGARLVQEINNMGAAIRAGVRKATADINAFVVSCLAPEIARAAVPWTARNYEPAEMGPEDLRMRRYIEGQIRLRKPWPTMRRGGGMLVERRCETWETAE